jgi:hypothetical protein
VIHGLFASRPDRLLRREMAFDRLIDWYPILLEYSFPAKLACVVHTLCRTGPKRVPWQTVSYNEMNRLDAAGC